MTDRATTPPGAGAGPHRAWTRGAGTRGGWGWRQAVISALAITASATLLIWFVSDPLFGSVLDLLHRLRPGPLLLAVALIPLLQWLRGWRFSILLRRSADLPCRRHFRLAAQLSFLNLVLPFKIGDFSFPLLARKTVGAPLLRGTVAIVWCRLNDLCVTLAILSFSGALLIAPDRHPGYRPMLIAVGVAWLLLPLVLAPASRVLRSWRGFGRVLDRLPDGVQLQHGGGPALALTLAIWSTHSLIGYLAVAAVVDGASMIAAAFAGAASNLAFALPITGVAGLGPPQAAWAAALHLSGASWEIAIATGLLMYGCILLGAMLTVAPTLAWRHERGPDAGAGGRPQWSQARLPRLAGTSLRRSGAAVRRRAQALAERLAGPQRVGTGMSPR